MFDKVSVLVPTRNRTHLLRSLIDSYRETTVGCEDASELVFRADEDDAPTREILSAEGFHTIIGPRLNGYASLPIFFNELAAAASGDVLMLGNDDVEFVTPGWAPRILRAADGYPDGVFNIGVKTHNEGHFPLSTVSAAVVRRLGFIYDPRIFWGDIYLRDVMGRLGRQVVLPDVEIQHNWAGFAPDQTFNEGEGARRSDHMKHHVAAVDDAVAKLQPMVVA
jgi:glycosyltransferase involved in cell wall biosynthesis